MENKLKNIYISSLLFLAVILFTSCQDPVQPNPATVSPKTVIKVIDNVGKPLSGVTLYLKSLKTNITTSRTTSVDGAELGLPVAIEGEKYEIKAIVPQTGSFSTMAEVDRSQTITVNIPCRDTAIVFQFTPKITVFCNTSDSTGMDFNICANSDTSLTFTTPVLNHNCDSTLDFTMAISPSLGAVSGLSVTSTPNMPALLGKTEPFKVSVKYNSTKGAEFTTTGTITITGNNTPSSGRSMTYIINVRIIKQNCVECNCPSGDYFVNYRPDPKNIMTCVGSYKDFTIPMNSVINTNKDDCKYVFTVERGFKNSDLQVNTGNSLTLNAKNTSLTSITVRFRPSKRGVVYDTITYGIKIIAPDGTISDCSQKLRVAIDSAYGGDGVCKIDSTADPTLITTNNTLQVCIGSFSTFKILRVLNVGECPLTVSASAAPDSLFSVSPSTATIQPGAKQDFVITFTPDETNISPTPIQGNISLTGCQTSNFTIFGVTLLNCCKPITAALHKWNEPSLPNPYTQSVTLRSDNSLETSNDASKAQPGSGYVDQRTIWVSAIDVVAKTATLETGHAYYQLQSNSTPLVNQDVCFWRDNINYSNNCPAGAVTSIGVALYDVLKVKITYISSTNGRLYSYCGKIWITKIEADKINGKPIVEFEVAYP